MDDLVQFLRDRYDDETRIAGAATPGPWAWEPCEDRGWETDNGPTLVSPATDERERVEVAAGWGHDAWGMHVSDADAAHIAAHHPARVLADVEAKRELVKLHGRAVLRAGGGAQYFDTETVCRSCEPNYQFRELSWPCTTLRLLALPYADHPDYRDEWRP
jgi:hypothetical protein